MPVAVRFILLVIGIVVGAAMLLAPYAGERLAMLWDEGKQRQIIALLEPRLARDPDNPRLLATLGRSYAEIGSYPRATELLERYITLRPDDGQAYAQLADVYQHAGNMTRRIANLQRHLAIAPTLSRTAELAGLYRQQQRTEAELSLLTRFEADLTVESGLVLRLAELHAGMGNRQAAIRVLMHAEGVAVVNRLAPYGPERLFLAGLLVESGRSAEAVRLGKRWILQWREPWLASRLLQGVALHAPLGDAAELGEAVVALHPEIRFFLAHELATTGAGPVARGLLSSWVTANPSPSMDEIAGFLTACRAQDEPAIVWQSFAEVLAHATSTALIARYSEAIAAEFGIGALAPFWASLPKAVVQQRPLLAARLAFHEHNPVMAKWLLESTDLATLEASDRRMWVDLLIAVASPAEAFAVLRDRRRSSELPPELLAQYARLAGGLGEDAEYRAALADAQRKAR